MGSFLRNETGPQIKAGLNQLLDDNPFSVKIKPFMQIFDAQVSGQVRNYKLSPK
jgi:hypothetical protein